MTGPYWIKQWISNLALLNEQFRNEDGSVDFEALGREEYAFRTAIITRKFEKSKRAKEIFAEAVETYTKTTERARKGGLAKAAKSNGDAGHREAPDESANVSGNISNAQVNRRAAEIPSSAKTPKRRTAARIPDWTECLQFVNEKNLDYSDAREWFEMTVVDRDGKDRDGNVIVNWKAALKAFCISKTTRRKTA